ncbi:MAG: formylglycine-generating enzyme family protein, partial [Thiomargarita sp.]|nr:formylglycine-generating enzyme family protein [Thiomargarita sp.]
GTFIMGSATEPEQDEDESPEHEVTVKSFYLSKYPITQTQWKAVMGNNPSFFKGDTRPVERVLWHDTLKFYKRLSEITGRAYRLPSEAEWEYACRANTTTYFHYGDVVNAELVNYNAKNESKGIYLEETSNVGSFSPNAFGLYDMHGNVYEWCADPWHENYDGAPSFARVWEEGGVSSKRILRGGSWLSTQWYCRSTTRNWLSTVNLYDNVGFRVALIANAWCST